MGIHEGEVGVTGTMDRWFKRMRRCRK